MSLIGIAILDSVDNEWRVHGTLVLLIVDASVSTAAANRLLSLDLAQSVLKRSCLHVVHDTLLANTSGAHRRWGHIARDG